MESKESVRRAVEFDTPHLVEKAFVSLWQVLPRAFRVEFHAQTRAVPDVDKPILYDWGGEPVNNVVPPFG